MAIDDFGGAMLQMTFILCAALFLAMLLGGRDFGQMRPGLANTGPEPEAAIAMADVPAAETVVPASDVTPVLPEATLATSMNPAEMRTAEPNTVFTLRNSADTGVEPTAGAPLVAEAAAGGEIWYVTGNSVNVRSGPSTNDEVVGKLSRGEATLVVWREDREWARIRIEGDGIEGYVAARFLTLVAPAFN